MPLNNLIFYISAKKILSYCSHFQRIVFMQCLGLFFLVMFCVKIPVHQTVFHPYSIAIFWVVTCLVNQRWVNKTDFLVSNKTGRTVAEKGPLLNTVDLCNLKAVGKTGVTPSLRWQRRVRKRLCSLLLWHCATSCTMAQWHDSRSSLRSPGCFSLFTSLNHNDVVQYFSLFLGGGFMCFPGQLFPWQTSQAFYLYIKLT